MRSKTIPSRNSYAAASIPAGPTGCGSSPDARDAPKRLQTTPSPRLSGRRAGTARPARANGPKKKEEEKGVDNYPPPPHNVCQRCIRPVRLHAPRVWGGSGERMQGVPEKSALSSFVDESLQRLRLVQPVGQGSGFGVQHGKSSGICSPQSSSGASRECARASPAHPPSSSRARPTRVTALASPSSTVEADAASWINSRARVTPSVASVSRRP